MDNVKKGLYTKLNHIIDDELEKGIESMDAELISECVDGILRLKAENSYKISSEKREQNIDAIIGSKPRKHKGRFVIVLLVAAILLALLIGSAIAYTVVEFKIHDYGTYSEVWSDIIKEKVDEDLTVEYIPEGFKETERSEISKEIGIVYENDDGVTIVISKSTLDSVNINTEYGKAKTETINGIDYILFGEDTYGRGVVWFNNDYQYNIVGRLSEKELLKIAQGVS